MSDVMLGRPSGRGLRDGLASAHAGPGEPVTVSEVVLLPGPKALTAPEWLPWSERVRPGDLGAGDLLPTRPDDPRLVPGYLASDDPAVEDVTKEIGLGRKRVLSPETTSDRQGFVHPYVIEGGVGEVKIRCLLRDFDTPKLA